MIADIFYGIFLFVATVGISLLFAEIVFFRPKHRRSDDSLESYYRRDE